jgi:hypothetical protein
MIELTTGVILLVSSVYGSVGADNATNSPNFDKQITVSSNSYNKFLDSKSVEAYVRKEYADTPILIDIARCESTFRQYDKEGHVVRGRVNSADVGVMQINEKYHSDTAVKLDINLYTVEGNVAFGKYLYKKYGAEPWSASSPCWATKELAVN